MNIPKTWFILLALLLAAMAMVPYVCAETEQNNAFSGEMERVRANLAEYQLPDLKFDNSQEYTIVSAELSPVEAKHVQSIPKGSIIYHSLDGTTRVFDSTGKQILVAEDKQSAQIKDPNGVKPATWVHELPSGSTVDIIGDRMYATKDGKVILTIVDENVNAGTKSAFAPLANWNHFWFEYAEAYVPGNIRYFDAYWRIPTQPPSPGSGVVDYLFNAISTTDGNGIVQPVLAWNRAPYTGQWSIASFALRTGRDDMISPAISTSPNHVIRGTLEYNAGQSKWYVRTEDTTTAQVTSIYSGTGYVPDSSVNVQAVFEGWLIDSANDIPGDTTFYNMAYKDQYNNNVAISYDDYYDSSSAITPLGLSVDLSSSPGRVILNTAN